MKIIFSHAPLKMRSIFRTCFCVAVLCVIFYKAQIYQNNNPSIYISEDASIIEAKDYQEAVKKENEPGQIFISKNAVIYNKEKVLSAKIVFIESSKKTSPTKNRLASIPKQKKIKPEKIPESTKKNEFNFISRNSDSTFQMDSANLNIAVSSTNVYIKAILTKNANLNSGEIVYETFKRYSIFNEKGCNNNLNYFFIRPPPMV